MSLTSRRILFAFFVLFFAISAPLIVLYTAGYRYNIRAGQVLRSGVFSITSTPKNAMIYLNGIYTDENTLHIFKHLSPDSYEIELRKEGFHSWFGKVDVQSGYTTNIQNVLLFTQNYAELKYDFETTALSIHPQGSHVVYSTQEGGWTDLWLLNLQNERIQNIGRLFTQPDTITINWSVNGAFLSVLTDDTLNIFDNSGREIDFAVLPAIVNRLNWHPSSDEFLYIEGQRITSEVNIRMATSEELAEDVLVRLDDNHILRTKEQGGALTLIKESEAESEFITVLPKGQYTTQVLRDDFVLLKDDRNELYGISLSSTPPILFQDHVETFDLNRNGEALLYTDGIELNAFLRSENIIKFIDRKSEYIKDVAWHPSESRVFIATDSNIQAIDTYKYAQERDVVTLVEQVDTEQIWLSNNGKVLNFFGTHNAQTGIFTLELTK